MTKERFEKKGISKDISEIPEAESTSELEQAQQEIIELKKRLEEIEAEYQGERARADESIRKIQIDYQVKNALNRAGALNTDVIMPLISDFVKDSQLDENGNIVGLDDKINSIKENENTSFLFKKNKNIFSGITPASAFGESRSGISNGAIYAEKYGRRFLRTKE